MTPFEAAEAKAESLGDTFYRDLLEHFAHGVVYSTATAFVMGRAVALSERDKILDPAYRFDPAHVDCWHIWLAAGDMNEFFCACPFPLPWLSWERNGIFRSRPFPRTVELCKLLA